mmetsp:Transcript_89868/g.241053  ORF Transcript_89868/g.241053 Transcript_89868/m.241053 type:complete len:116 (+) Transcript_89868:46-393(+)
MHSDRVESVQRCSDIQVGPHAVSMWRTLLSGKEHGGVVIPRTMQFKGPKKHDRVQESTRARAADSLLVKLEKILTNKSTDKQGLVGSRLARVRVVMSEPAFWLFVGEAGLAFWIL